MKKVALLTLTAFACAPSLPVSFVGHDVQASGPLPATDLSARSVDVVAVLGAGELEANLEADWLCEHGYQRYGASVFGDLYDFSTERVSVFLKKDRFETYPVTSVESVPMPGGRAALRAMVRDRLTGTWVSVIAAKAHALESELGPPCSEARARAPSILFGAMDGGRPFYEVVGFGIVSREGATAATLVEE